MFETERLVLRAIDEETDSGPLLNAINNVENKVSLGRSPLIPETKASVKKRWFSADKPSVLPVLAFCLKPTDATLAVDHEKSLPPLGMVFLTDKEWDIKNRIATFGILVFKPEDRGKGYGREVSTWTLEYAFMELGVHRVELQVYSFNERAIRLYRNIGFIDEGRKRKAYFKTGVWHDELIMAVLEEDWFELRKKNEVRVLPSHLR